MTHLTDLQQTRERLSAPGGASAANVASILFPGDRRLDIVARPGGLTTEILRIGSGGMTLGRVISSGHEIELEDNDNITFLLPGQGWLDLRFREGDHRFGSGSVAVVQPGRRRTRVSAPPGGRFLATTLQVPTSRMRALTLAEGAPEGRRRLPRAMTLDTEFGHLVRRILPQIAGDVFRQPGRFLTDRVLAEFNGLVDDLLSDVAGGEDGAAGPRRILGEHHRVCLAEDIMQARGIEPLSIAELARELGITPRSLQLAFRDVHGISPRQYLERVRLHWARQRLLSAGHAGSVTSIAFDCGFLHLGRFGQAYLRRFGERPSETLARHRP